MNETLEEAIVNVEDEPFTETETFKKEHVMRKPRKVSQPIMVASNSAVTNTEEIDQKISEYIVRGEDGKYSCGYCGKSATLLGDIKRHIETHIEGLSFSCQSCDKTFRSRNVLHSHYSRSHKNNFHH